MTEAKRFTSGCVASPHHLASAAGLEVLASDGNALDAAIAMNLTLGVVTPYFCGFGGDLFAMIWRGGVHAYNGSGRAPAGATVDFVRRQSGSEEMPLFGPHSVTVPGAVEAWFRLLDRFGTRSFGDLARTALRCARDGFVLSDRAATYIQRSRAVFRGEHDWLGAYSNAETGREFRQPGVARTIENLSDAGPDAYYRGEIAEAIVGMLSARGSAMTLGDLAEHEGEWVEPLRCDYHGYEVLEMPPNTQGVAALEALQISEVTGASKEKGAAREHLLVEAMKLALSDRDRFVSDPAAMTIPAGRLLERAWIAERGASIDASKAGKPPIGRPARGGTAYMCAADSSGMCVSLIQSNYVGFGSGVHVPGWGINLHNRGGYFSLDPSHVNAIEPRKRTLHTLIPAMVLRDGKPWLVFGTMGGDGQAQTHLQLLTRIIDDGAGPQEAIDAPRWIVSPSDWAVATEPGFGKETLDRLVGYGHRVRVVEPLDTIMGHAQAILAGPGGFEAASDPRSEGAALGF